MTTIFTPFVSNLHVKEPVNEDHLPLKPTFFCLHWMVFIDRFHSTCAYNILIYMYIYHEFISNLKFSCNYTFKIFHSLAYRVCRVPDVELIFYFTADCYAVSFTSLNQESTCRTYINHCAIPQSC